MDHKRINPDHVKKDISCKGINAVFTYIEKEHGADSLTKFIDGLEIPYEYLKDTENWISWGVYLKLMDRVVEHTGDPQATFKMGKYVVLPQGWQDLWFIFMGDFLDEKTILKNAVKNLPRFNNAAEWELLELTATGARLKVKSKKGFHTTKYACNHRKGAAVMLPIIFGMPPGICREIQCETDGADYCIEEYTWKKRPRRAFTILFPAAALVIQYILGLLNVFEPAILNLTVFSVVAFLIGFLIDDRKIMKSARRINFEQNRQLEKSLARLEDKYDELKKAEEIIMTALGEKEVLLKEVHHRVKNNMQVIISLLNIQSGYIDDKRFLDMLNESRDRIRVMALVHEKLYQSKDLANIDLHDYIKSLANHLLTSYSGRRTISLRLDVTDVQLNIDVAIPCGLIINELVSNSLKHAFAADREGEVKISFRKNAGDGYELTVSDNGAGMPEHIMIRETKTLGLQLVTNLVEHQLQGLLELNRTNGTEFYMRFKAPSYKKRI